MDPPPTRTRLTAALIAAHGRSARLELVEWRGGALVGLREQVLTGSS